VLRGASEWPHLPLASALLFELLDMRTETVSERTAETAVPPKKPPAPSVERGPRNAVPASRLN
jgi:hypothetical protein